jgi:hypothetical protein
MSSSASASDSKSEDEDRRRRVDYKSSSSSSSSSSSAKDEYRSDDDDIDLDSSSPSSSAAAAAASRSEAKAAGDKHMYTPQQLLDKVQEYFYSNEELSRTFEDFAINNAHLIDLNATDSNSEFKLEYTTLYEEYKNLFESKVSKYIEQDLGSSIVTFYSALKNKVDCEPHSAESVFAQILISIADFDVFMMMMNEAANSLRKSKK